MRALLVLLVVPTVAYANPYESGGKVDEYVGAYTESIPIIVPPFHGLEPKLTFQYHSARGSGLMGVGWALTGFSVIERTDGMYSGTEQTFELDGQLLLPCSRHLDMTPTGPRSPACEFNPNRTQDGKTGPTGTVWYSTVSESYLRMEHGNDPTDNKDTWVVWKPDGVIHYYKPAPQNTGRWLLAKVVDTSGNTVTYNWLGLPGNTFNAPASITYNGTIVSFGYQARSRNETYAEQGALETMDLELGIVDVCVDMNPSQTIACGRQGFADPRRARTYKVWYQSSNATARPLVSAIKMFGRDAVVDGTTIVSGTAAPGISVSWTDGTPVPTHSSVDVANVWNYGHDWIRGMTDFDGDGRTDLCRDDGGNAQANMKCTLARGASSVDFWVGQVNDAGDDQSGAWVDWNGDGRGDYCRIVKRDQSGGPWDIWDGTPSYRIMCAFSLGMSGINDMQVGVPLPTNEQGLATQRWFVDWNGDGRVDYCRAVIDGIPKLRCAFSNGASYVDKYVGGFDDLYGDLSLDDVLGFPETRAMVDWNGDGRLDFCRVVEEVTWVPLYGTQKTGREVMRCLFGRADEFNRDNLLESSATYHDNFIGVISNRGYADTQWWVDVNGDGKTDYCRAISSTSIDCAISRQRSLLDVRWGDSTTQYGAGASRAWGDINGDGRMDLCFDGPGSVKMCAISAGLTSTVVSTGITRAQIHAPGRAWMVDWDGDGRSDYCFNSDYAGENGSRLTCLYRERNVHLDHATTFWNGIGGKTTVAYAPSTRYTGGRARSVVATTTTEGGDEGAATRTFTYGDSRSDAFTRRFLGFGTVRIDDPCLPWENGCPYTVITSRIDWRWPTVPRQISRFGGYAEVSRTERVYADTTTRPYRSDMVEEKQTQYEGIDAITTRRTFGYDQYGNVTRIDDLGVIADTTGYFGNLADDDRALVTQYFTNPNLYINNKPASITGSDAQGKLTEVLYTYDGNASWQAMPTRGFPTETQSWLDTIGGYVSARATYDAFGNLTSETNRNNYTTTYEIDPTYHVYITRTTLPPAGTPAVAQSMSTPLPHWDVRCGVKLRETHDQNATRIEYDYDPLCRKTLTEYPGGGWETIAYTVGSTGSNTEVTQPGPVWRRTYFDGLGRATKVVRSGTPEIVEKEFRFDLRGNVAAAYKPRYAGASAYGYTFTYDPRDRETSAVMGWIVLDGIFHPGDVRYTSYSLTRTITTDALGHAEMTVKDVRGRVILTGSSNGMLNPRDLTKSFYDRRGNLARIEQPTQQGAGTAVTSYTYDSLGRKLSVTESNAGTRTFGYDAKGNLTSERDAAGVTTRFLYDALDRRISKISPFCKVPCPDTTITTWRYDEPRAGYANIGKLTSMDDAAGTATYDYDAAGNLVRGGRTVDGSKPYVFAKQYDIAGRLLATTYPDGSTVGTTADPLTYDSSGRIVRVPGIIQSATYDAADQLTSYEAPSGAAAMYDTANPRGDVAGYTFQGRDTWNPIVLVGEYDAASTASATVNTERFSITSPIAAGQILTVSTCGAAVPSASGTGDTLLRVMFKYSNGPWFELASNDNSHVSGCGALSTVTVKAPGDGSFEVVAGCAGNAACSGTISAWLENDGANLALNKTVYQSSILDPVCGPPGSAVDDNPNAIWCSASSMLHTQWQPQPWMIIDLGGDQHIRRIEVFNRNDTNLCDAACQARLANFDIQVLSESGGGWQPIAYVPEQAQFPTMVHVWHRARYVLLRLRGTDYLNTPEVRVIGEGPNAYLSSRGVYERTKIRRDLEGRISSVDSNHARSSWTYAYSPDHTHELWSATNQGDATLSRSSGSDNGNIYFDNMAATYGYAGSFPHALSQDPNAYYTYDANGQMTWMSNRGNLTWNRSHQLTSFGGVAYGYDGEGYRLKKTFAGETTIYLGDDYEITSAGHTKYISLGGRLVAKQTGSAAPTTLFTDHLGSVVLGLESSGQLAFTRSYGPWGETITGEDGERGYTGQVKDENGLIYLHARFYDPSIGRFISPDPTISSPHPIGMNRYAYAFNDPINHSDIDGLGVFANVMSDFTIAMGETSKFLSQVSLVNGLDFLSKETGLNLPIKKYLGGFNIGIGNSLALVFGKFHALGRGDYVGFGKQMASEAVIAAAITATIMSEGAAAPLVAFIVQVRLPYYLTLIHNGNFEEAWGVHEEGRAGAIKGVFASGLGSLTEPYTKWLGATIGRPIKDWFGRVFSRFSKQSDSVIGPPAQAGITAGTWIGAFWNVLSTADPYVNYQASAQATSVAPQSRLSSGSGLLFGYGYRAQTP